MKILNFSEYKSKYPNGRMKTPPKPKPTAKREAEVNKETPVDVPLGTLPNFAPESTLWNDLKVAAIAVVDWRDTESIDECIRILTALRETVEIPDSRSE